MEMLRRSLSWSFALIAAISLILAGIWGAQVALVALRRLMLFNFTLFVSDMRTTRPRRLEARCWLAHAQYSSPRRARLSSSRTIVRHQRQGVARPPRRC